MLARAQKNQARGNSTRTAIMRAATELFAQSGYKGTPIRAILKKAGVSMGSFYHHFKDKADLYISIADEGSLAVRRFMRSVGDFETGDSLNDRAWSFFRAYIQAAAKNDSMVLLLISEKETLPENIKTMMEDEIARHRRDLEQGLMAGVEAGLLKPMDARMASEAIVGMVLHMVRVYFTDPSVEMEDVISALARSTVGIIRSMPGLNGDDGV
ncbi:TetR/AcrR family transcriptional regulator [Desulfatibacillum aliphaticivorans]|uniref:TetR/AcrR family transcriptional regulator n=1 Tax=Desulfatibacillum aliphaticivorans TaxID=218208 RepID=UPI0004222045|nr:TetR/AcrR family transcriptional regulator [Desulfatibacillum aliphaticivorans]